MQRTNCTKAWSPDDPAGEPADVAALPHAEKHIRVPTMELAMRVTRVIRMTRSYAVAHHVIVNALVTRWIHAC
jgi:hypothetical protein